MKLRLIAGLLILLLVLSACSVRKVEGEGTTDARATEETPATTEDTTNADTPNHVQDTTVDAGTDAAGADSTGDYRIGEDAALAAAKAYLGDTDPDTGYKYAFAPDGIMEDTDAGKEYYKIRVSWYLEDQDRYSVCGYLLVSLDGGEILKFDW